MYVCRSNCAYFDVNRSYNLFLCPVRLFAHWSAPVQISHDLGMGKKTLLLIISSLSFSLCSVTGNMVSPFRGSLVRSIGTAASIVSKFLLPFSLSFSPSQNSTIFPVSLSLPTDRTLRSLSWTVSPFLFRVPFGQGEREKESFGETEKRMSKWRYRDDRDLFLFILFSLTP